MNTRQIEILKVIKDSPEPSTVSELAAMFTVSQRTIQNDLNTIDDELLYRNIESLFHASKKGCYINKNAVTIQKINQMIYEFDLYLNILSPEGRLEFLFSILALKQGYTTISTLAESLNISRNTILNDIKKLRNTLTEIPIQIIANSRYGMKLSGEEKAIRTQALEIYMKNADSQCVMSLDKYRLASICNHFIKYWDDYEIEMIYDAMHECINSLDKRPTENSFLYIISCIEFSLARMKMGKYINLTSLQQDSIRGTNEFKIMGSMLISLSEKLGIHIPLDEISYLSYLLLNGVSVMSVKSDEYNYAEIQWIVCRLIDAINQDLKLALSHDSTAYKNLIFHLKPAIYRIQNHIELVNPLLSEIKTKYSTVFRAVNNSINILEEIIGMKVSEDEIGYIAIHFIPIMETKNYQGNHYPNIVIVCDSGIGTSYLLTTKLSSLYEVNIIKTIALYELKDTLTHYNIDAIVSTIDLDLFSEEIECVKVSPFITKEDARKLDKLFNRQRGWLQLDESKFLKVLNKYGSFYQEDKLIKELSDEFNIKFKNRKGKEGELMLKDVVSRNMIELDYRAMDWEQAVREAGRLLKENGCVGDEYIESMVSTVKTIGTYIVISKGIALPHSRSGKDAYKVGISILRLKEPVVFGHPENDPVDLLFALSSIDNTSHLTALQDLSQVLNDPLNIGFFRSAKTADEIIDFIEEKRKEKSEQ